ncbi:MAG: ATP-binding protein [Elusimicrobia bacterium]|nr:ATP-binding protein [Elusimicrobiota bacterium]MBP9127609.1 ATP-binding protein [Elusimicrobiota bacterium]
MEITRLFSPPKQSFFLFGPRGTGKTMWTKKVFPKAQRVNLLAMETLRSLSARPERLKDFVMPLAPGTTVVIDEVQKVPDLLSVVHDLMEEKRGWQFILTGSSARKLKREGVDLLAGRALTRSMHPFLAVELGDQFSLERALEQGLLPVVWSSESPAEALKSYIGTYVREEVQAEGLVRNLGNFHRFLEAISFSQASVLNVSNVARECEVERKTVVGFADLLEDLLLSVRLPVFTRRAKRKLADHPKFYFCDAGIFRSIRPQGPLDAGGDVTGAALEGLVFQHLRAWNAYGGDDHSLYYWRTVAGVEVDFVIYGPRGLWAVEVKNTVRVRPQDLRALKTFKEDFPEAKVFLLYRGKDRLEMSGILCLPVEKFLRALTPGRPLDALSGGVPN